MQESRIEMNWRVVMTVAKTRAPYVRMVWEMNSWPTVAAAESARTDDNACNRGVRRHSSGPSTRHGIEEGQADLPVGWA